jgi:hypothetical protein
MRAAGCLPLLHVILSCRPSISNILTLGMTPWTTVGPSQGFPSAYTGQHNRECGHTSMPRVEFEPTIPVYERPIPLWSAVGILHLEKSVLWTVRLVQNDIGLNMGCVLLMLIKGWKSSIEVLNRQFWNCNVCIIQRASSFLNPLKLKLV